MIKQQSDRAPDGEAKRVQSSLQRRCRHRQLERPRLRLHRPLQRKELDKNQKIRHITCIYTEKELSSVTIDMVKIISMPTVTVISFKR